MWDEEIAALPEDQRELARQGAAACAQAAAKYSKFRVGAALRVASDGEIFTAANVENASYGLTSCAERNAVFRAVASRGKGVRFDLIALVAMSDRIDPAREPTISPCGACRQVLWEFKATKDAKVLFVRKGKFETVTMRELLPDPFFLPKKGEADPPANAS